MVKNLTKPQMTTPIVIHNESEYIRAGLSSGDTPSVILKTDSVTGKSPIEKNVVTDWEGMVKVWERVFAELDADPKEHPILMSEPPLSPKRNREKTVQVLFETFGVPGCYLARDAVLALYDFGRATGCVVNVDADVTYTVPVYEGYTLPHATFQSKLPHGDTLDSFFGPGAEDNLADMTYSSIARADVDIRPDLYLNIVVAGSGSKVSGLCESLTQELTSVAPAVVTIKIELSNQPDNAVWNGGDRLAPMLDQYGMWISRAEYDQSGPTVVHRKCF